MLDQLVEILSITAPLSDFGHTLGVSFEVNLAYTILLRLGKFSNGQMANWVIAEKVRVIPPLAEDPGFDAPKFSARLDGMERAVYDKLQKCNWRAIAWAIIAACVSAAILMFLPYFSDVHVSILQAAVGDFFLFGATPIGVLVWLHVHRVAKRNMNTYSKAFNVLLENRRNQNAEKIAKAQQLMERKLKAAQNKKRLA